MKEIFSNGVLHKNPLLMYAIGLCPIVAVTTTLRQAVAVSIVTSIITIVVCMLTNLFIKKLTMWIRVAVYFGIAICVLIPSVWLIDFIFPNVSSGLGIYVALLSVNTLYLYRSEGFSRKNTFGKSVLDALFTSLGYTLAACIIGAIREILANGTIWDKKLPFGTIIPAFSKPFGAFIIIGFVAAVFAAISNFASTQHYVTIDFDEIEDEADNAAINALEKKMSNGGSFEVKVLSEEGTTYDE